MEDSHKSHRVISQLGTFDVENYGDLLYPLLFRHVLKSRQASLQVCHYSPTAGEAPQQAGFETHSLKTLFDGSADPRTCVVGGGDLLRTDWDVVASHYATNSRVSFDGLRRSIGPLNALEYLSRGKIAGLDSTAFYAHRFRNRWMNYPAVGPFLIDAENLPAGSTVSYLSCGVPHDFSPVERSGVRRILDQARFIYLRDEQSAEKLQRAGVECEIHVAPDLAVTLSDQFDRAEQAHRAQEILSRSGVDRVRSLLCFQCQPYPGFDEEEIIKQLRRYQERSNSSVVLLPVGHCHGDQEFLQSLAWRSGGAFKIARFSSIIDIMSVIAASDLFVGTSLHGNITAVSFGIPHLFGPLPVDKAAGLFSVMNLPSELKLCSWTEMNDRIDFAVDLGRDFFAERAIEAKEKVYQVLDKLLRNLLN